jgi:hypothetical protein
MLQGGGAGMMGGKPKPQILNLFNPNSKASALIFEFLTLISQTSKPYHAIHQT